MFKFRITSKGKKSVKKKFRLSQVTARNMYCVDYRTINIFVPTAY